MPCRAIQPARSSSANCARPTGRARSGRSIDLLFRAGGARRRRSEPHAFMSPMAKAPAAVGVAARTARVTGLVALRRRARLGPALGCRRGRRHHARTLLLLGGLLMAAPVAAPAVRVVI